MSNAAFRLISGIGGMSHVALATAAMAHHVRAHPIQAQAVLTRVRALHRLVSAPGVVTMLRANRQSGWRRAEQESRAADRSSLYSQRETPMLAGRQPRALLARNIKPEQIERLVNPMVAAAMRQPTPSKMIRGGRTASNKTHALSLALAAGEQGLAASQKWRSSVAASLTPRLSIKAVARQIPTRAAAFATSANPAPVRHAIAARTPQQAVAPGFHRTVRQPLAKATMGNVYLDKTLVGYHLAAAVTAEQTRAAARPNISATGFNSSMATLRPAGAGS